MNSQTETQEQDSLTEEEALSAAEQEEIIDRFLNSAAGTLMQLGVLVLFAELSQLDQQVPPGQVCA